METIAAIMAVFSLLGAADRMLGNRFGLGEEFEKGFQLLGSLALAMLGMLVMSPLIAEWINPAAQAIYQALGIDPSLLPTILLANDLGGGALARQMAVDTELGRFNGLVVSSMMGGTISFTIPYVLDNVDKKQHEPLLLGLLCGVVTIPLGCLVAGVVMGVPFGALLGNLLPLLLVSIIIGLGLVFFPGACTRIFRWLGVLIKLLITVGLALGILRFLTGIELVKGLGTLEDAFAIVFNCAVVLSGAFPMLHLIKLALGKGLARFGEKIGVNDVSAMGLLSTLAASQPTYEMMARMDKKGVMLNGAFSVSAAFVFADHLAFTLAFDPGYLPGVIVGKLVAGVTSVIAANIVWRLTAKRSA